MTSPDDPQSGNLVTINQNLSIPVSELHFRFSRSSGPGGQHVNRSETRVELLFDVRTSPSLTEDQRRRLHQRLGRYLTSNGVLHLVESESRSQFENRARVMDRFRSLLAAALRRRKRRIPTKPSAAARERRMVNKKARSGLKRARRDSGNPEYD